MSSAKQPIIPGTVVRSSTSEESGPRLELAGGRDVASAGELRQIAREAYLYGFPLVVNYQTMYKQAVDKTDHNYKAPFNVFGHSATVAAPEDTFVVTPNSDTPYSYLWLDLRAEPIVITMPKIEKERYYTGQLIDLYTFNFAYLGTRSYGNDGGSFLVAGPGWRGETPEGVKAVFRCETDFAYALFRTQLFNPDDLQNVKKIQSGYGARPLSKFLNAGSPPPSPTVNWPKASQDMAIAPAMFGYLNFLLQFCPTHPSEKDLMARFAKLNIGAGRDFAVDKLSADAKRAIGGGLTDAGNDFAMLQKRINAEEISSAELFGTREFLKNNYLYRFCGAKLGLYGNSGAEAIYLAYFVDANNRPCDASKTNYTVRFPKGQLPPAGAFWSLTMYDGKSQFLVANPLKRYLLNPTMLEGFKYGDDGALTFYIQKDSPGAENEPNWLPAPNGPFYGILRIYMPAPEVINGTWKRPRLQPTS